ncbi:MAG TPA: NAD(P)/FAD-dependent oxidoreductase [Clostridiales bacterium]|nr:NAD(P)/FAD-dependent oxidoreductase [Clostridiales bacterium]
MAAKIVIVGAGYAGILTAKKLAKRFKKDDSVFITLIDKNPFHTMLTELHEVAACRVDEESIRVSLKKVFAGRKVDVRLDTITSIDFSNKKAVGEHETYDYDYLVLCAGSKPTFFGIPGAQEYAYTLWSYDDAVKIRHRLTEIFTEACRIADSEERRKLLSFYIVGAGFTGVEMAGELAEYMPILCEKYEIDRRDVNICLVDTLDRTITNLPTELSAKAERRLRKMGVNLLLGTSVVGIGPDYIETMAGDNAEVVRRGTSTVIWCAGIESADITAEAAKELDSAGRGRIKVDGSLRSVDYRDVFVIGDNMLYTPPGEEHPVPQVVENCEHSADVAAHNLTCLIRGSGELIEYKPKFHGFMVSIGGRYGVARVGFPKRMFNLPSFLAMLAKHFINIIYFVQVLGWTKVWGYCKHEFFTIRNRRSFVGGHFSNRTPSFLLVPLRVWLGAVWVYEGVMKLVEGWLKSPKLEGFFGGATAWYNSILGTGADGVTQATTAATDAVTSATGAVADAVGTTIINWDILGLFRIIFVSGKELASSTISDYAFKIDIPLLNRFIDSVVLSSDGMQLFMQGFIVIAEILIGLALIGGLLTTPAAAFSLILQLMFVCTTGLYLSTFWMVFAGIAVLIAAGRIFGLDYYAMPALKEGWKRLPLIRKLYLYND